MCSPKDSDLNSGSAQFQAFQSHPSHDASEDPNLLEFSTILVLYKVLSTTHHKALFHILQPKLLTCCLWMSGWQCRESEAQEVDFPSAFSVPLKRTDSLRDSGGGQYLFGLLARSISRMSTLTYSAGEYSSYSKIYVRALVGSRFEQGPWILLSLVG